MAFSSSRADCLGETNAGTTAVKPIEEFYAAYGPGIIARWQADSGRPGHGIAAIQMQDNIGLENETRLFTVSFSPITSVPVSLNSNELAPQWSAERGKPYFVCISRHTNGYFLSSVDFFERWEEEQKRRQYLASGRLEMDKASADALLEEIQSVGNELARLMAELEPLNLSEDVFRSRIAPLEKRDKELRAELEEVWSNFKYLPHDAEIFKDKEH